MSTSLAERGADHRQPDPRDRGRRLQGRTRVVTETISGNSAIEQRPGFLRLLDKLEPEDVLIVTKLDRLGRNAIDVAMTVNRLAQLGVRRSWTRRSARRCWRSWRMAQAYPPWRVKPAHPARPSCGCATAWWLAGRATHRRTQTPSRRRVKPARRRISGGWLPPRPRDRREKSGQVTGRGIGRRAAAGAG